MTFLMDTLRGFPDALDHLVGACSTFGAQRPSGRP
jgi:hypothetical protein